MELKKEVAAMIDALSQIGSDPTGGMTRLLYTDSWKEAQSFVEKQLKETGLTTSYDAVGNLFGRMEGSQYPEETILSGSHIDTVVNGGTLDGQYGVVAAALAIKYLKETYGQPLRSLEVISMAEEEGSRFPTVFGEAKTLSEKPKKPTLKRSQILKAIASWQRCNAKALIFATHKNRFDQTSKPSWKSISNKAVF